MEKKEVKPTAPKATGSSTFDIQEINELLKAFTKSNVNELKLEKDDFKITIRQGMNNAPQAAIAPVVAAPIAAAPAPSAPVAPAAAPVVSNGITIKAPMIGTFYRSAGPGKPTFVNVGDRIEIGQPICIIEAMKLFNEIEAEVSGTIVKVLIDDASPVEFDQPLFIIEP